MSYATVTDMTSRFGDVEMLRVCVADGLLPAEGEPMPTARIEQALWDASVLVDSYLRARYAVPVSPAPAELVRATCVLARYDLAHGGDREPSEQMRLARKEVLTWLADLGFGRVSLEGLVPVSAAAGARFADRPRAFTSRTDGGL
ncbi:DUF1320 domain-containing protein [Xanthobacter autotrophicus]|uniref:gp436 family protein n=1 Tax=Xanthobacter TaxID=279 RepID=UPI0024AB121F|nr:DUF1320 domain-containing protein [Xanthobacter autotrophicus]MDI4664712.1 DUF1320 domain-containing protein [Xanthobacter autotrophicus]